MRCPNCNIDLVAGELRGVEFDYCQKCHGIWLERAELNSLIERAIADVLAYRDEETYPLKRSYLDKTASGERKKTSKRRTLITDYFDFD